MSKRDTWSLLSPARVGSPARRRSGPAASSERRRSDDGRLPFDYWSRPRDRTDSATMVSRNGHLRSALVVVHGMFTHGVEPPALRAALCCLHSPDLATPRWPLASHPFGAEGFRGIVAQNCGTCCRCVAVRGKCFSLVQEC